MSNFFLHIFNSIWKELLLLRRDKAGLMVLFLMPSALVVIITLVQENVMELTGEKSSNILLIDRDADSLGAELKSAILKTERIHLTESDMAVDEGLKAVRSGDYQALVYIEEKSSEQLRDRAAALFDPDWDGEGHVTMIPVYFDPGVLPGFRTSIVTMLQFTLLKIEMENKIEALEAKAKELLPESDTAPGYGAPEPPEIQLENLRSPLLEVDEQISGVRTDATPNSVQRNIPAWSLFGLFFTCIPLAGSLLLERKSGIWIRLKSQPVSPVSLLIGKIIGYVLVCFCQVVLIVVIGRFLFPQLGLAPFVLEGSLFVLILITLSCSLAACGYGVFLGSICSTMEQASMFGSISIVIAAALGGTLVPTYAMPAIMQNISVFSPLNWGLNSYLDVLLRGWGVVEAGNNILKLIAFFGILLLLSWQLNRRSM